MTFGIAWKDAEYGYVIADSGVTMSSPPRRRLSSLGEVQRPERSAVTVEQAAMKIFLAGGGLMTFAGDATVGLQVVKNTDFAVRSGIKPIAALRGSVQSVMPLGPGDGISLIAVYHTGTEPILARTDTNSGDVTYAGSVVHVGSLGEQHVHMTTRAIEEMISRRIDPPVMLVAVLAMLQSYGIHFNLIDRGIAGHYTGAASGPDSVSWQPDLLYVFYNSYKRDTPMDCISSTLRDDVHIVVSSISGDTRGFANLTRDQIEEWRAKWEPDLKVGCDTLQPHYVVFIDTGRWRVVLVETAGSREHLDLSLGHPEAESDLARTRLSPHLQDLLYGKGPSSKNEFEFSFVGFKSPDHST